MRCYISFLCLVGGFGLCMFGLCHGEALADGNPDISISPPVVRPFVPAERIDPRLPPVIPGQEVVAGGRKHKVISTSGPLPGVSLPEVAAPILPAGPTRPAVQVPDGVSVIIDRAREIPQTP